MVVFKGIRLKLDYKMQFKLWIQDSTCCHHWQCHERNQWKLLLLTYSSMIRHIYKWQYCNSVLYTDLYFAIQLCPCNLIK